MRYYDTQLTPTTQKSYREAGDNRYPETDERVANWFKPSTFEVDGILTEHTRSFDGNGFPVLTAIIPPTKAELDAIEAERIKQEKIAEAKQFLIDTDYMFLMDVYPTLSTSEIDLAAGKRAEARLVVKGGVA